MNSMEWQTTPDSLYLQRLQKVEVSPIFILGDQRSGTTLLYKILADTGHFNAVRAYHIIRYNEILSNYFNQTEAQAIEALEAQFNELGISDRKIDHMPATPHLPEEYGFILKNAAGDELFLTPQNLPIFEQLCRKIQVSSGLDKPLLLKNPWDFAQFLYVKQVVPNAKFIFIHRNPIHVISSRIKASRSMIYEWNDYTALLSPLYAQIFSSPIKRRLIRLLFSRHLGLGLRSSVKTSTEAANYFIENINSLPAKDYISIKYEDLCKTPESTIKHLMSFLNMEDDLSRDYYSQVIRPRPSQLLPEVQKRANKIQQKSKAYFDYYGYSA